MVAFNYSNISAETTLTSGISPSSTVVALNSSSGLPVSYPYTLLIDYGAANVEVMTVTGPSGTNFAVTRGEDGTAAQSHNPGARVVHGVVARDLKQPQDHIAASTGVHGAAGSVVGTIDVQTLSNKTINGASNTLTVRDADITGLAASKLTGNFNGGSSFVSAADATVPLAAKGTGTATGNLLELYKGAANQFSVDPNGAVTAAGGVSAGGVVGVTRAVATDLAVTGKLTGDTNNRVQVQADGTVKWGPGNATQDATLARSGANTLALTGNETISGTLNVTGATTLAAVTGTTVNGTTDVQVGGVSVSRGIVAWGNRPTASPTTVAEIGVLRIDNVALLANRAYRISTSPVFLLSTVTNDIVASAIRASTAGVATTASAQVGIALQLKADSFQPPSGTIAEIYRTTTAVTASFLLTVTRSNGSGNVNTFGAIDMWIEDMGPTVANSGVSI